ncbi:hypothetical protein AB0L06_36225 [Spirillospora sp. NPDC052269]
MTRRVSLSILLIATLGPVAACGGGADEHRSKGVSASKAPAVSYSGPAIPGLAATPAWHSDMSPFDDHETVVPVGDAFATLSGEPGGFQVSLLEAATGKRRMTRTIQVAEQFSQGDLNLSVGHDHGTPVAVLRYPRPVPASGTTAEHVEKTTLVWDATGRQVWASSGADPFGASATWRGGYVHAFQLDQGPVGSISKTWMRVRRGAAGAETKIPGVSPESLADIVGDRAVLTTEPQPLEHGLRAVDLNRAGARSWEVARASYFGTVGTTVYVQMFPDGRPGQLRALDAATGAVRTRVTIPGPPSSMEGFKDGSLQTDADTGSHLALVGERLMIWDGTTGRVRWFQSREQPRSLQPRAAGGGMAFLEVLERQESTKKMVALDDRTGKVQADGLPIYRAAFAGGMAAVLVDGGLYGFPVKRVG